MPKFLMRYLRIHSPSLHYAGMCWCQEDRHKRVLLFRWHKRTQLDIRLRRGYLSLGLDWRAAPRLIVYTSPDATPMHPAARHYFGVDRG